MGAACAACLAAARGLHGAAGQRSQGLLGVQARLGGLGAAPGLQQFSQRLVNGGVLRVEGRLQLGLRGGRAGTARAPVPQAPGDDGVFGSGPGGVAGNVGGAIADAAALAGQPRAHLGPASALRLPHLRGLLGNGGPGGAHLRVVAQGQMHGGRQGEQRRLARRRVWLPAQQGLQRPLAVLRAGGRAGRCGGGAGAAAWRAAVQPACGGRGRQRHQIGRGRRIQ